MAQEVKTNSLKAWYLATRPKTLSAATVPVMIGIAFAIRRILMYGEGWKVIVPRDLLYTGQEKMEFLVERNYHWLPGLLCLLFAWVMQINSNFINDYFDYKHGNDDETRLGPKRACAEGWVTPKAMRWAIAFTSILGCCVGLPLILFGGLEMILVGLACVVFCFLYTTVFSYHGLGDVLVLLFFGVIPVCCTYYICMPTPIKTPTDSVILASIACGLVVDTLLMVNNYRDIDNDRKNHKNTLVVRIGKKNARWVYQHLGFFGLAIMCITLFKDQYSVGVIIPTYLVYIVYAILHRKTYQKMFKIDHGRELNQVLGMTARNIFVFGIITFLAILSVLPFCQTTH